MKKATIFISHSSKDALISNALSEFLIHIGIPESRILCSSKPGTHIRTSEPLYPALRDALNRKNVLFLMLLSDNYYDSVVCLNEMGAAWANGHESFLFVLPGFSFENIKGVVKENEPVGISLASINDMTNQRFSDFKEKLKKKFKIKENAELWERERESFYQKVRQYEHSCLNTIPMDEVESFCIGQFVHNGCEITEKLPTKTVSHINFALTEAQLCSIVFHPRNHDWRQLAERKKCLCFYAYSNMKLVNAEVELKTSSGIGVSLISRRHPIVITDKKTEYCIPLRQFSANSSDFTYTHEICFLFLKDNMPTEKNPIEITVEKISLDK